MTTLDNIYQHNISLLKNAGIEFNEWQHEPILDFETDLIVAKRLGWTGTHSKSLFLKLKGGGFALYLTDKDKRLDSKRLKQVLGKRPSVCSDEEMISQTHCVPGAVCPFVIPSDIPIVVDQQLYQCEEILYTPGEPTITIGFAGSSLPILLSKLDNTIIQI
ncbi:YbaK/EbsC family protein [Vibrio artabrorum]|uniref:YbaK/EbsC family protein n=1 Tax=Vibrio artabrorum TaxID=446374 RepID=UPI0021C46549|nr:YbaK/EbsC family protein [Vibrio artabrorum]